MAQGITTLRPEQVEAIEAGWPALAGDGEWEQELLDDDQEDAAEAAGRAAFDASQDGPWSRARMLREVADLVDGGLPAPMSCDLFVHAADQCAAVLRMDDGAAGDVDAWQERLGLAAAVLGRWIAGANPFRSYRAEQDRDRSVWPGWRFEVWCAVDEPAGPAAGGA